MNFDASEVERKRERGDRLEPSVYYLVRCRLQQSMSISIRKNHSFLTFDLIDVPITQLRKAIYFTERKYKTQLGVQ